MEKCNNINFNILISDDEYSNVLPLHISDSKYERVCDMLMVKDIDNKNNI